MRSFIQLLTLTFGFAVISRTCATNQDPAHDEKAMEQLIRSVIKELCPGANVCLDNQTIPFVPNENSCCTECSCAEECEDTGNCCFQRKRSGQERKATEAECVFPTVPQPVGTNRIYYQSYRMISNVRRYNERGIKIFDQCGNENVAAWGSLFPVFSQATKKIYKNMACADAANVTDGKPWDVLFACDRSYDASRLIYDFNLGSIPDHCEIQFKYLLDQSALTSLTCFEDLIDSCGGNNFTVPNRLPLSKEEISNACSSGFITPFRHYDMYANIFCHICNDKILINRQSCKDVTSVRGPNGKGFFSLLNSHFMSQLHKSVKQLKLNAPLACSSPIDDEGFATCRTVHCPLGQIRDEHGECVFMIKKLFMQKCSVFVKLTANVSFSINDSINRSDISYLSNKWSNNWLIGMVSYETENENNPDLTNSLIVEMLNESPVNDLRALLTNIKHFLKKQWTLKLVNNTLISMSAEISHDMIFFPYNPKEFIRNSTVWANVTFPVNDLLYTKKRLYSKASFRITRLYFCEQVELDTHEFEWFKGVMFDKITSKPLFPGDYTISTFVNDHVRYPARICIENSGFRKREGTNIVNSSGIVPTRALQKKSIGLFIVICQLTLTFN